MSNPLRDGQKIADALEKFVQEDPFFKQFSGPAYEPLSEPEKQVFIEKTLEKAADIVLRAVRHVKGIQPDLEYNIEGVTQKFQALGLLRDKDFSAAQNATMKILLDASGIAQEALGFPSCRSRGRAQAAVR